MNDRSVYGILCELSERLARENLDWPKEIVLSHRAFVRLLSDMGANLMSVKHTDGRVSEVEIALPYGPCVVRSK